IRLVKVARPAPGAVGSDPEAPHEILDLTIDVQLEGEFDAVYTEGDNRSCLPTDTMKNTVYALARQQHISHVETFAAALADHFAAKDGVVRVRISAAEARWARVACAGRPHPHAFVQAGSEEWTTVVVRDRDGLQIVSGLTNLVVLKTTDSA